MEDLPTDYDAIVVGTGKTWSNYKSLKILNQFCMSTFLSKIILTLWGHR